MKPNTPSNANNSKGKFLSQEQLAEIRNALTIILGYAQLLEREPEITQEQKRRLEAIAKQTHRIAQILQKTQPNNPTRKEILKDLQEVKEVLK